VSATETVEADVNLEDPTALTDGPPEEEFWERYNRRLEFPLATVGAVLLHMLIAAFLVMFFLGYFGGNKDRSDVPINLVPDMGGLDDTGEGSAGSGGVEDPLKDSNKSALEEQLKVLPNPAELPTIKENIRESLKFDNEGNIPISDFNAPAYSMLDKTLRDKVLGIGAKKGAGPGAGSGDDGSKGTGPGGTGANSTRARSLRWVMRFRTSDGADYLAQLRALKAVILVPRDKNSVTYFRDLSNPSNKRIASDTELSELAGLIRFTDTRPDSVRGICEELGVKENIGVFFAYFPREMEAELSRKEIGYRNRRPEDVEETIFRVAVKGGSYEIMVDDQKAKR
jgi:hypothetical protein